MGAAARSWDHPRWSYDETRSAAARRSAARVAERTGAEMGRPQPRVRRAPAEDTAYPGTHRQPMVERQPSARPALRVVHRPRTRFGSIVVLVAALGMALMAPVGLNVAVVRSQFQVAQLQERMDDLIAERSALKAEHAGLSSTQRVKEAADRLGMVTPPEVGFIDLGGRVASDDGLLPTRSASAFVGIGTGDGLVVASASREAGPGQ